MRELWIPVTLIGALALAGCSDPPPKESKGEKGDPGPQDQRVIRALPVSAGSSYERCTLWRQPEFDNPARDDRLRKTIARTAASMPFMEEDEVHKRTRGSGKFATSLKRAKLFDFRRSCDGP